MRNGIKLFGAFEGLFIEPRVGGKAKESFVKEYACRAGEDVRQAESFMIRDKNGWQGAIDAKVYFNAPEWVIESLGKLGFRVVKRQIDMDKYEGGLREYPYKVCSKELFWWLVDYGYKAGKNAPIPWELYLMRDTLKKMREKELVKINHIESESPIDEARLLAVG
jgi:hypothetical protein